MAIASCDRHCGRAEGFGCGIMRLFDTLKIIGRTPYRPHKELEEYEHWNDDHRARAWVSTWTGCTEVNATVRNEVRYSMMQGTRRVETWDNVLW